MKGHKKLAELVSDYDVHIITQNVDNLHERAGSSHSNTFTWRTQKVRSVSK